MIDQLTIDKIRDTAQIVDVVSEFVSLRRRGQNYVGLCPFHSDKNPSFYVSQSKNFCKCFSCGEGGDPIHFIMKHEQISYMEAIRWLAKKYNIEIREKELSEKEKADQNAREGMLRLNEFAMGVFENDLYESQEGRNVGLTYFRERGLQDETIKRFHLGYALESKIDLSSKAIKAGHKPEYLLDPTEKNPNGVGLCYEDEKAHQYICRFHGRVIFPFMSLSGKPVAFGGRILQRVDHAFKKYVNSPESPIYHKSNMLYGIFQAKREISKQDKCYIVEGNVDVISMSQAGFENVVASAGTALTTNQIHIIQRFTKNVTLMFDGDEAGIRASLKTIDLLLLEGMRVKLVLFPDGDDPDSFCRKHTTEELQQFFERNEQDFITYKTQMLIRQYGNNPQNKAYILQNIIQSIALIDDPISSSLYLRDTAQTLNVPEQALLKALEDQRHSNYASELRRMEIEQRREEAQMAAAVERGETPTAPTANPTYSTAEPTLPTLNSDPLQSTFAISRKTDPYERSIIRSVIRYGGERFNLTWKDENGEPHIEEWRVIDFIGTELASDNIAFQNPLYAKVLQIAFDATSDPNVEFNSIRYFSYHENPEVSQLALELAEDRAEALGIAQNEEKLETYIPRIILELKECLLRLEIESLQEQMKTPGIDLTPIIARMQECMNIKKEFDRILGERVISV